MGISTEGAKPCGAMKGMIFNGERDKRLDCPAIQIGPVPGDSEGELILAERIQDKVCELMRSEGNKGVLCPVAELLALDLVREWAEVGYDRETIEAELRKQPYSERFWGLAQAYLTDHFGSPRTPFQS
jgi:hypothetical protein